MPSSSDLDDLRRRIEQCLRLAKHTTDREMARMLRDLAEEYQARLTALERPGLERQPASVA